MSQRPLFCIIDASSFIFRAFYAVRPLSNKAGLPTNAVFGFAQMILKVLQDFQPTYIAVVYDTKHPSFRKDLYPDYKANRGTMPEDLVPQIPYIKKFVEVLGLPGFERPGFEADDVIATLAHQAAERSGEADVCIISSDKDLMQLVGRHVYLFDTMKELRIDEAGVKEKLGVPPSQVADYLGIVGDSSDNIPGVKGVGPKGAVGLLEEFGSLEGVYENLSSVKKEALRTKLEESRDLALLSKRLATVKRDLDIALDWHSLRPRARNEEDVKGLLEELEFQQLLKRIQVAPAGAAARNSEPEVPSVEDRVASLGAEYRSVLSIVELKEVLANLRRFSSVAVDTETNSLQTRDDCLVGVSLCASEKEAFYIPLRHEGIEQCDFREAVSLIGEFLAEKKLIGQNMKFDVNVFRSAGVRIPDSSLWFDTMVASYVLDAEDRHGLDHLAEKYFSHRNISYEEVCGSGKQGVPFSRAPFDLASRYAAEDAHVTLLLAREMERRLAADSRLQEVFRSIDMPLVGILADLEWEGVSIDRDLLRRLGEEFGSELRDLEKRAVELAGEEFNLASPKQLQHILFEKLKLPALKKTKTGFSTDVEVLEKLAWQHELPSVILQHRELAKLKSTYVDVLPELVHPASGRVHARFHQTVAATGRLSSSDPNLQNIPVRTESGKRIRASFVARPGFQLVGADYSQIELRILAAMCGDPALVKAFHDGIDIHTLTASQVFGVPESEVNPELRRQAKAINFGLLYGKTAYSLGEELGIGRTQAAEIIRKYFEQYPTVKAFLEGLAQKAKESGYAETVFGRRRRIDGIQSKNKAIVAMAERMAVNTPIQGTAADVMKRAMIRLHSGLAKRGLSARLILQVHDELVVEAPDSEVEAVKTVVKESMEGAGLPQINVPLTVETNSAENWLEL